MAGWAAAAAAVIGAVSSRNASKRAAAAQTGSQTEALEATERAQQQARADAIPLFTSAQRNALKGIQSGLNLFQATIPAQIAASQQSNLQAQQTLLSGLEQQRAALLGGSPVDLSQIQAQQATTPPISLFSQQLPFFETFGSALGPNVGATPSSFFGLGSLGEQPITLGSGMDITGVMNTGTSVLAPQEDPSTTPVFEPFQFGGTTAAPPGGTGIAPPPEVTESPGVGVQQTPPVTTTPVQPVMQGGSNTGLLGGTGTANFGSIGNLGNFNFGNLGPINFGGLNTGTGG
jgi:hypothetical protein